MRVALLVTSLGLLAPGAASAASHKLVVDSAGGPALFSGTLASGAARIARVPECRMVSCDAYKLKVKLPQGLWDRRSGGVHVAIRFIAGTPDDNLQLAVYRKGRRIGASTATVGTAQSVLIPAAKNGDYDVYVVDGVAFGLPAPSASIAYEGLAEVNYDPPAKPRRDLIPDLVALPQQNITFGPPFEIFDDPVPAGSTCHQSEIDESGAHVCLRFDQVLGNIGTGPLDIRFDQPAGSTPHDDAQVPVRQRIYRSDGSFREVASGSVIWHAIHQHYHFDGFAQSRLWRSDIHGRRVGSAPIATGEKVSFCIATTNINPDYWAKRAFGADAYPAPDCLSPDSTSGGLDHFKQGMSVGWTDEYNWFLPGQYVEVSGVPDGDYVLDTTVDPTNRLIESDKTNNCGAVRVRLSAMDTPNPQAQGLGVGPSC
jgi:lysyl oxidase